MDAAYIPKYLLSSSEYSFEDVESFCKAKVSQINQSKRNSFDDHIQTHTLSTYIISVEGLNGKYLWDVLAMVVSELIEVDFPLEMLWM